MGYTHYPQQLRDLTDDEWQEASEDIRTILAYVENEQGVPLRGWDGTGRPEFNATRIAFNGAGENEHETFNVYRQARDNEWGMSCKTARKPYDIAVTAILCYLCSITETHDATSDGYGRDFLAGLELARQALPRYANRLDLPMGVMKSDRWCAPWFQGHSDRYEVHCCVDGYAYIVDEKTGKSYRFYSHFEAAQWAASHIEKPITVHSRWFGSKKEGGASIFNAYGSFDEKRNNALRLAQNRACKAMIDLAEGDRAIPPPAYVRPGELPLMDETPRAYNFMDLLKLADA